LLHLLVAYDVNTVSENGSKRLYNLSKVCIQNGQRVQYSLFECQITETQFERFRSRLLKIVDQKHDSLRIYHLRGKREEFVETYGIERYINLEGPLIF